MAVVDQFVVVSALKVFVEKERNISRFGPHLLTCKALIDVLPYTAVNTEPRIPLLDTRYNLSDALVSHGIMRTEQNLVLYNWGITIMLGCS